MRKRVENDPPPSAMASIEKSEDVSLRTGRYSMLRGRQRLQKTRLVLAGVLLPLLFSMAGYSQSTKTGGVAGVVKDQSGAVVAGATVSVINQQTGKAERTLVTSSDGTFSATMLTPGTYTVQIKAARFSTYQAVSVAVNLNEVA